jgi:hypothetical protein
LRKLRARGTHDPVANGNDEARFLGKRDEFDRRNLTHPGVPPADERFGTHHVSRLVDLGLVVKHEMTICNGLAHFDIHHAPHGKVGVHDDNDENQFSDGRQRVGPHANLGRTGGNDPCRVVKSDGGMGEHGEGHQACCRHDVLHVNAASPKNEIAA